MHKQILTSAVLVGLAITAGCRKNAVDKSAFKSSIDNYLSSKQQCLWAAPIKFPVQADKSNDAETKGFDALTDAGLLVRKPAEKKRFLIGSKQVNDYDLSSSGRSTWTPDPNQPGYGNFCYGHAEVASVDSYTPQTNDADQYTVAYHYDTSGVPAWANSEEMKTAFPKLGSTSVAKAATANLMKGNSGWVVQSVSPDPGNLTQEIPAR